MKIAITGAAGFLGRALCARLLGRQAPLPIEELRLTDLNLSYRPEHPRVRSFAGDLRDPALRADLVSGGLDLLIHLAALPSGASEGEPGMAKAVNLDAAIALFTEAAAARPGVRVVHASSIAALGPPQGPVVTDDAPLRPTLTYGALKVMLETWLTDMTRRGDVRGLSLRLPGLVARPLVRTGQASAFLSDIFHHMHAGEPFTVPVSPDGTTWLMSVQRCVDNFVHAATLPAEPALAAITLPAVHTSVRALVSALAEATGHLASLASYAPDPRLQAVFASYPPLNTPVAEAAGFRDDGSVQSLAGRVLRQLRNEAAAD
jgi:nucleoside-diphosphate-sugar epimerase